MISMTMLLFQCLAKFIMELDFVDIALLFPDSSAAHPQTVYIFAFGIFHVIGNGEVQMVHGPFYCAIFCSENLFG